MKKKFQSCYNCDFRKDCKVAEARLEGLNINSPIIRDIGCFDFDIYRKQIEDKQLGLF